MASIARLIRQLTLGYPTVCGLLPALIGVSLLGRLAAWQPKILAQQVIEELKAAHPEIVSLEVAAPQASMRACKTIAATEAKEVGQKCDKDELTAIKTNKPFIEQEKTEFDATLPIHDARGAIIGTLGMDLKREPGLDKAAVERVATRIVAEFERRLPSREQLFQAAR